MSSATKFTLFLCVAFLAFVIFLPSAITLPRVDKPPAIGVEGQARTLFELEEAVDSAEIQRYKLLTHYETGEPVLWNGGLSLALPGKYTVLSKSGRRSVILEKGWDEVKGIFKNDPTITVAHLTVDDARKVQGDDAVLNDLLYPPDFY